MYLDDIASVIRSNIPDDRMPTEDAEDLLRSYAVLLRAKGADVTQSDIHDAWSAWMVKQNAQHPSLVAYVDLDAEIKSEDSVFATAIRQAADQLSQPGTSSSRFTEVLFPSGLPENDAEAKQVFDLYKMMVDSSESLVGRRHAVNTFFLTMNGALLTASGLIVQNSGRTRLGGAAIAVLAFAGAILCGAWRSLIESFGQLNRGKFKVINTIERHFKAAIYAAEWEALGRGEDPAIYRSFTSREIWVPNSLLALHLVTAVIALLVAVGVISLGG